MTKSSSRNPMELIDRYLQAVRFWLPRSQHDLAVELAEDLHSQVEAKETALGRPPDEGEVSAILKECGNPLVVAGRLRPQDYLIGPTLFPAYQFVLKMVLLWILLPLFVFIVGPVQLVNTGSLGAAIGRTIASIWSGGFIAAGIITLVFVVLERTQTKLGLANKWDPRSLPPLEKSERKTSSGKTACELIFNLIAFAWLLLLPYYPVLILGPAAAFLNAAPTWHTFYAPVLLLAVAAILRSIAILAWPQWPRLPVWTKSLQTVLSLVLVNYMINAAGQTANGQWHPFVVVAHGAEETQSLKIAAIVNVSILLSLVCTWLGLCIAAIIQTWQAMRSFTRKESCAHGAASLHVL
jgi:hypothetical protein